ncbi:hypothetical protein ACGFWF_21390 [Streptomyces sp. NPDC048581]|uniref:TRADD-N-associated membrane domain-containing protein n=1 Tax=Streptomyces sp. NPDC048581 TaxID=3365572 RepID=UPI003717EA40
MANGFTLGILAVSIATWRTSANQFKGEVQEERQRLRAVLTDGEAQTEKPTAAAEQRIDDDRFAELLIEYYAYGLTQARSSFLTSQRFAKIGAAILLGGVALAVWYAETSGDLYLGIVISSVGAVVTLIGQLFHRRADIALGHMTRQTESLRDDMRLERSTEQAILLLSEVEDPEVKTRLQAGLITKLSGASLPQLGPSSPVPAPRAEADGSALQP